MPQPTPELSAAITAVRRAAVVCRSVQLQLATADALAKKDRSPVTVADFASQAVVCFTLAEALGSGLRVVGEEQSEALRQPANESARRAVVAHTAAGLGRSVSAEQVLGWIDLGGAPAQGDRYWALDPIDGTKGFLRREQYAIALALIEGHRVTMGVLGCPNLDGGLLLVAQRGGGTHRLSLWNDQGLSAAAPVKVSKVIDAAKARFCESVESAHSDQDASAGIARRLGITLPAVRMDSQAKYAALATGRAEVYLRLPNPKTPDYREFIWDHAAGSICVEEAGGTVTDIAGAPLDFTHGRRFERNRGVVATNGALHAQVVDSVRAAVP